MRPERQAPKGLNSFYFFLLFFFFLNIGVRCPSHNWSKLSTNRDDFWDTHSEMNIVLGDVQWVHSVKGFRSYGTTKSKNIFKIFPCYFRPEIKSRDFSLQKHASGTNGWTDFDEPYLVRRKMRDLGKGCFLVAFCGGVSEYFRKKRFLYV